MSSCNHEEQTNPLTACVFIRDRLSTLPIKATSFIPCKQLLFCAHGFMLPIIIIIIIISNQLRSSTNAPQEENMQLVIASMTAESKA